MSVSLIIIFTMFHIVSDTIFQTEKQNVSKYEDKRCLIRHVLLYSINMTIPFILFEYYGIFGLNFNNHILDPIIFFMVMFISHYIIDYNISKRIYKLWEKKIKFFLLVQLDQFLHYIVLFITLYLLQK